jgi:hypothetical protein
VPSKRPAKRRKIKKRREYRTRNHGATQAKSISYRLTYSAGSDAAKLTDRNQTTSRIAPSPAIIVSGTPKSQTSNQGFKTVAVTNTATITSKTRSSFRTTISISSCDMHKS